ncbi:formylglycine-generating enzyme family protein [Nitrosomonas sp. wSCUT-2]
MTSIQTQLKGARSRADLLIALALAGDDAMRQAAYATLLGFVPKPLDETTASKPQDDSSTVSQPLSGVSTPPTTQQQLLFAPYRLTAIANTETLENERQSPETPPPGVLDMRDMHPWDASYSVPQAKPIVPWTRLWPRLRQAVAATRGAALDVPQLVQQISQGRVMHRLPRKQRLSWPDPLPVVADFSDRLTPYWQDWLWLQRQLHSRLRRNVQCYRLRGIPQQPLQRLRTNRPEARSIPWPQLNPGSTLLIVSDLGMTAPAHSWPRQCWQAKLTGLKRRGVRTIVLSPASLRHLQPQLTHLADYVRLSPDSCLRPLRRALARTVSSDQPAALSAPAAALLTLMSCATRVEPALLRELRSLLPDGRGDAGIEGEVWCHHELDTAATACAIAPWAAPGWQEKFKQLPPLLQQRTLECLRDWHARLPQAIHHEETLLWQHLTTATLSAEERVKADTARQFFNKLANTLQAPPESTSLSRMRMAQLAERHIRWVAPMIGSDENYLHRLSVAVVQAEPARARKGLPAGIDPVEWMKQLPSKAKQRMDLVQDAHYALQLQSAGAPLPNGATRLATFDVDRDTLLWAAQENGRRPVYFPWHWQAAKSLESTVPSLPQALVMRNETGARLVYPALIVHTSQQRMQFDRFIPPAWAAAWGQDAFGFFADLLVHDIRQRFRWIAPGSFLMGSPENETQRYSDETQHPVTLTQGFWLADTACTQALWQAVMDDNPSHFKGDPGLPVERVSWLDVQQFIERLNALFPGLQARLPSEAQWEYACRAGTQTAFAFGDNITPEQVNYDGNYPYAGGSKGLFREKTVPVKSLSANPWGLYEMHGNVWEWCTDWFGDYPRQAVIDPVGPGDGEHRVVRGGSWISRARYARSAYRGRYVPDDRYSRIGFRLAPG